MASSSSASLSPALSAAIEAYNAPDLAPFKFLTFGGNDGAAVSDGTMGCHQKEAYHLKPAIMVGRYFRDRRLLDMMITKIKDCDEILARLNDPGYTPPETAELSFEYVTRHLGEAADALTTQLPTGYLAYLNNCLALRAADTWVYTPFGKAVSVRGRKTLRNKRNLESDVQRYVLEGMENMFPTSGTGYPAELGKALRASMRTLPSGLKVPHFAIASLCTLHQTFRRSNITRFEITRLEVDDGEGTVKLRAAYTLHFRHMDGRLVHADDLAADEIAAIGTTYVMESKVLAGQTGEGFASGDDREWLATIKKYPAVVLLAYFFTHTPYPEDVEEFDLEAFCDEVSTFEPRDIEDRADADNALESFNMRGTANCALKVLYAAATFERDDLGAGATKYIETLKNGFAYREPVEPVGLTIHHIHTGTGDHSEARTADCNRRHGAKGNPRLGVRLLVEGNRAYPYNNVPHFRKLREADEEGTKIEKGRISAGGCDESLFAE